MMKIRDAGVLITGGSQGLGRALAQELAARGARVALAARGRAALEKATQEIGAGGGTAHALACDVGDPQAAYALAARAAALVGPVDLLINAASTLGEVPLPVLLDARAEDVERVFQVNVLGPFRLIKAVAGQMAVRGTGLVLNVSSDAAVEPYPGWGAYGASKAALDQLTRIWAAELEPAGVKVISVDPGEMDTQMHADALPDADRATLSTPDAVAAWIVERIEHADSLASGARLTADVAA